jgi:hypothetical protein
MSRATSPVRRSVLAWAAVLAGCKGQEEPRVAREHLVDESHYQVSDPVAPPCIVREGAAITIERHGSVFRIRSNDREDRLLLQGDGIVELTNANTPDVRAELRPDAHPTLVMGPAHEDRCWFAGRSIAIDWAAIVEGTPFVVPLTAPNERRECFVPDVVVRVQRVRGDAGEVLRIEPTSTRVRIVHQGTAFQGPVEITLGAPPADLRIELQVGPDHAPESDAGTTCVTSSHVLLIPAARVPDLGSHPLELTLD